MDNNDEFKKKSLKLLADPRKLKHRIIKNDTIDRLKYELNDKFNCDLTPILYQHILDTIQREIEVSSIIDNIITSICNGE